MTNPLQDFIRNEIKNALAEMLHGDAPKKTRGKASVKITPQPARAPRAKRMCPVSGCKNSFSPRSGGYCKDHRNTAGYKTWLASKEKK